MNKYYVFGDNKENILLYLTMPLEYSTYHDLYEKACSGGASFSMVVYEVEHWNDSLSPWGYRSPDDKMQFGGGAKAFLEEILGELIPALAIQEAKITLAGYSLAGLFALWALQQSSVFAGAISCSGSLWFPDFLTYMQKSTFQRPVQIYLSLGEKEEKTKHPVMASVGEATRALSEQFSKDKMVTKSILEWNPGDHFTNPQGRLLKGLRWYYREKEKLTC